MDAAFLIRLMEEFLQTAFSGSGQLTTDLTLFETGEFWRSLPLDLQTEGRVFLSGMTEDTYCRLFQCMLSNDPCIILSNW